MSQESEEETEMRECERCGDGYEAYEVYVLDDPADIAAYHACEWDNLCKPCRMAVTDYGAYLTETEKEELEPKTVVESDG